MYILKPVSHNTIWGGTKLTSCMSVDKDEKRIGHLYMVNGHEEMSNVILNGKNKGMTLHEAFPIYKKEWNMVGYEEFPLTIALVDANDNLSIQVHPSDIVAEQLENKKIGKTESWVFLDAPNEGWIYAGCNCQTKYEVENAIEDGIMEQITEHFKVEKEDYVCVKSGTLHAMTAGSFVYEIEYGSDFTYRFYDYNRKDSEGKIRELHIDKALKAIELSVKPEIEHFKSDMWISEECYEICKKSQITSYKNISTVLECVSIIEGTGFVGDIEIGRGMTILLLPGDELENIRIDTAIIARVRSRNEEKN